jgi:hypothetical protein
MKRVLKNLCVRCAPLLLWLICSLPLHAQLSKKPNVPIDANCNGYLEYLPIGYNSTSQTYPLIIYLNGIGSTGNGSSDDLENQFSGGGYPHEQQRGGSWPDAFTVNGQTYQFLVITPQFIEPMWNRFPTADEVNDVINYSIQHYRVDTTRIYLMGQSQGGNPVWEYVSKSSAYANRIAAIVPFAGVSFPFQEKANIIKHSPVAVWAFHNLNDDLVPVSFTQDYVDMINGGAPPGIPAKKTIFNANGHLCWFLPLTRQYTENGMDVYQWMLQYKKTVSTAFAGEDQEITLPSNSGQLAGSGKGPNGTVASYHWQKLSGPAAGTISNTGIANPGISNLAQGTYYFRLTITDNAGGTANDDVAIVVNPAAQRIEAESYTAVGGTVVVNPTADGGYNVNAIDNTDWMDYSVTVPSAGTYRFRFRAGTFYGGTQFQVKSSSGTVLGTVNMYATGWDDYMNLYANIPLAAGTQTIRIQNTTPSSNVWYINWFEIINNTPDAAPLPVNLVLFNASCDNGNVNLLWKTAGEVNSRNFTIERSTNGTDWTALITVPAAGQSSVEQSYSFRDQTGTGTGFYRIVQQDLDGRKMYSSIIKSVCGRAASFSVYPNPVDDRAILDISLDQSARLDLSIVDAKGVVVKQQQHLLPQGTSQVSLNMSGLAQGAYTLYARWNGEVKTVKLVKK